jgi:hypothetical protein
MQTCSVRISPSLLVFVSLLIDGGCSADAERLLAERALHVLRGNIAVVTVAGSWSAFVPVAAPAQVPPAAAVDTPAGADVAEAPVPTPEDSAHSMLQRTVAALAAPLPSLRPPPPPPTVDSQPTDAADMQLCHEESAPRASPIITSPSAGPSAAPAAAGCALGSMCASGAVAVLDISGGGFGDLSGSTTTADVSPAAKRACVSRGADACSESQPQHKRSDWETLNSQSSIQTL